MNNSVRFNALQWAFKLIVIIDHQRQLVDQHVGVAMTSLLVQSIATKNYYVLLLMSGILSNIQFVTSWLFYLELR